MGNAVIRYHGGKHRLAKRIISFFPKHMTYIEPFCGSGAVFFEKNKSPVEVINDNNFMVYNFFKQWRDNPKKLINSLEKTVYSKKDFEESLKIYRLGKNSSVNDLEKARAFFVAINFSFGGQANGFRRSKNTSSNDPNSLINKVKLMNKLNERIQGTYIESGDALDIIKTWDNESSLFYLDPPYINTVQGPYSGYTEKDFNKLGEVLKNIKGKFILSSYALPPGIKIPGYWRIMKKQVVCSAAGGKKESRKSSKMPVRTELLTMNF